MSSREELVTHLAEWAVGADDDSLFGWEVSTNSFNTGVEAATRGTYATPAGAWDAAVHLWESVLGLGFALSDAGQQQIGVVTEGGSWRGRVKMVLAP